MEFGPDGSLYVIDWGQGFNGNNADSGIYRIDYIKGDATADRARGGDAGHRPRCRSTVQFSATGSVDPDGHGAHLRVGLRRRRRRPTRPSRTRRTPTRRPATTTAKLTVTDQSGADGTDTVTVVAGNTRPDGQRSRSPRTASSPTSATRSRTRSSVTDPEDGTTGCGISCDDVRSSSSSAMTSTRTSSSAKQGCEGTFRRSPASRPRPDANIFTSIVATYTDKGAGAGAALTGQDEAILHSRSCKRAEHNDDTGRVAGATRRAATRASRTRPRPTPAAATTSAFIENGDCDLVQPVELRGPDPGRLPRRLGRRRRQDRAALGRGRRPARRRDAGRRPDGRLAELDDVTIDLPADRAAGHARAVRGVHATRPTPAG